MAKLDICILKRDGGIDSIRVEADRHGYTITVFDAEGADVCSLTPQQASNLATFIVACEQLRRVADDLNPDG